MSHDERKPDARRHHSDDSDSGDDAPFPVTGRPGHRLPRKMHRDVTRGEFDALRAEVQSLSGDIHRLIALKKAKNPLHRVEEESGVPQEEADDDIDAMMMRPVMAADFGKLVRGGRSPNRVSGLIGEPDLVRFGEQAEADDNLEAKMAYGTHDSAITITAGEPRIESIETVTV